MLIKQNTWPALEVLKALAIISMLFIHSWGWIITDEDLIAYKTAWSVKLGNIIHFLCFFDLWIPALAGASLRLQFWDEKSNSPKSAAEIALKWGLILIISALVFELMLNNPYPLLSYNPLHFMGYSFLIIALLLLITPRKYFIAWTIIFLVVSIFKSKLLAFNPASPHETYEHVIGQGFINICRFYFLRLLFGTEHAGWGLIPWFSSILLGFSCAEVYLKKKPTPRTLLTLSILSGVISFSFLFHPSSLSFINTLAITSQYSALGMPTTSFISCLSGFVFLLGLLSFLSSKTQKNTPPFFMFFSRGSFWIFFIQFPIGYVFTPLFLPFSFEIKLFLFPIFIIIWCGIWGYFILELGKKRLKISVNKKTTL